MSHHQPDLFPQDPTRARALTPDQFRTAIKEFHQFGKATSVLDFPDPVFEIPVFVNEFWTSKQRAAHSLHEVSYRACFKPQLPRFFIERLTDLGQVVYDPFMGRGTSVVEAALLGRIPVGCDINPLSAILIEPRLHPPTLAQVRDRLGDINLSSDVDTWDELLAFYHPRTLRALTNLRAYLLTRAAQRELDDVDGWIRMVATNRLTGHSKGFFSVYTLPPNQAVSAGAQRKINVARQQTPPERDLVDAILRKSRSLLRTSDQAQRERLRALAAATVLVTGSADHTPSIADASVHLVVTSPPFLDVVDYQADNWLRCWFNGLDAQQVPVWQLKQLENWQARMTHVFSELERVLRPGGHIAFEVGEVRSGKILLEELVVPAAASVGFQPVMVLINDQVFTKTSNCWGVDNLRKGTNTNRIVLLQKPAATARS